MIFAVLGIVVTAGSVAYGQAPRDRIFDTRKAKAFSAAPAALAAYLDAHAPFARGVQHFCIVGFRSPEGDRRAWVHWLEGKQIVLWEEAAEPADASHLLVRSRRVTDLETDVVATLEDVHGSTYLVPRSWVRRMSAACTALGARYQLRR